ncbi:MAG TPA: hypothetical protein VE172_08825, partial [Stackebrandtia sp.]|nr:hypothetical protein [Stackebrandtia sp.]
SDVVTFDEIQAALNESADPDAAAQTLINLALEAGGPDNVTVLVGDVVESNGLKDKMTNALSSVRPR